MGRFFIFVTMKTILFTILFTLTAFLSASCQVLKPVQKFNLNIEEASDLDLHPNGYDFIVTTDLGMIHTVDSTFRIKTTSDFKGDDFEGLCVFRDTIYVSEENDRQFVLFDIENLKFIRSYSIPFVMRNGDRIEGMAVHPDNQRLILISEDKPVEIFIFNPITHQHNILKSESLPEIASLAFYDQRLFALSDESPELLELNPENFEVLNRWRIRVNNAEGIVFRNHRLYVVSDELRKAYEFEIPMK